MKGRWSIDGTHVCVDLVLRSHHTCLCNPLRVRFLHRACGGDCVFGNVQSNGSDADLCDNSDDDDSDGEARLGDGGERSCCWNLEKMMISSAFPRGI